MHSLPGQTVNDIDLRMVALETRVAHRLDQLLEQARQTNVLLERMLKATQHRDIFHG